MVNIYIYIQYPVEVWKSITSKKTALKPMGKINLKKKSDPVPKV